MTLQELLDDFGEKNGLGPWKVDDEGIFEINHRDMHIVMREFPELDSLLLYGIVGDRPPEGMEQLSLLLLKANHFFEGTHGATLSIDGDAQRIYLQRYTALSHLDADKFTRMLEAFCDAFEAWHEILVDFRPRPGGDIPMESEEESLDNFLKGKYLQV